MQRIEEIVEKKLINSNIVVKRSEDKKHLLKLSIFGPLLLCALLVYLEYYTSTSFWYHHCRSSETRHVKAFCANLRDERSLVILTRRLTLIVLLPLPLLLLAADPQLPSESRLPSRATPCLRNGLLVVMEGCRWGAVRIGRDDDDGLFRVVVVVVLEGVFGSDKSRELLNEKSTESADDDAQVVTVRLVLDWLQKSVKLGQPKVSSFSSLSSLLPFRKPRDGSPWSDDLLVVVVAALPPLCLGLRKLLALGVLVGGVLRSRIDFRVLLLGVPMASILRTEPLLVVMTTGHFLWEPRRLGVPWMDAPLLCEDSL